MRRIFYVRDGVEAATFTGNSERIQIQTRAGFVEITPQDLVRMFHSFIAADSIDELSELIFQATKADKYLDLQVREAWTRAKFADHADPFTRAFGLAVAVCDSDTFQILRPAAIALALKLQLLDRYGSVAGSPAIAGSLGSQECSSSKEAGQD